MNNNLVLLVQPNYQHQQIGGFTINPPMGLAYIAAVLEKNNIAVKILDANALRLTPQEVADKAKELGAFIVGVSIMTPAHNFSAQIARLLPKEVISVAGGPQASAIPAVLIKDGFTIAVRGEGEKIMLELAEKKKELKEILGISFRDKDSGKIIHNADALPLNPNELPLPARHLLIKNGVDKPYTSAGTQYFPWARITSSRGCPYDCNYCNKLIFGHNVHFRSAEDVMKEIDFLVSNYGVKEISFSDDCFNFDLDRAKRIFDLICSRDYKIYVRFSNGLRADRIDEEFLVKAKRAGCYHIAYGIESGSQEILDKIPKGIKLETIKKAVALTKKYKIFINGFFMVGLLGDTEETMQKTIDFAKRLNLDAVGITMAAPYPGTRMEKIILENGGKIFLKSWDDFHHTSKKATYYMPGMASPEIVEKMYRKFYRDYYFRLSFLVRKIPLFFQPRKWRVIINWVKAIFLTQT